MHHAINIADLTTLKQKYPIICDFMVAPVLTHDTVDVERGQVDGIGVLVQASVPDDQWQAIVTVLRQGLGQFPGYHKHLLRIYDSKTGVGGWKRI
jgi:hypothetical protein